MVEGTRACDNLNDEDTVRSTRRNALRRRLLTWYDAARRDLPWRAPPGTTADPYRVWISEIMLQQTTVATATPYFHAFVARWPTVQALAGADVDEVLHAWQGLGYYARARNLHACAREVAARPSARFPDTVDTLRQLPGVGEYTAKAIAAIAFGRAATPVDGNVARVLSRLHGIAEGGSVGRRGVTAAADALADDDRPGDFAQALIELGATVCRPRSPFCGSCPWSRDCVAAAEGRPERYPAPSQRPARSTRHTVAWVVDDGRGALLLRRRPAKGLLGGMMEVPSTEWRPSEWPHAEAVAAAETIVGRLSWRPVAGDVRHTFTHFDLAARLWRATMRQSPVPWGMWHPADRLGDLALPTVTKKMIRHAIGAIPLTTTG